MIALRVQFNVFINQLSTPALAKPLQITYTESHMSQAYCIV